MWVQLALMTIVLKDSWTTPFFSTSDSVWPSIWNEINLGIACRCIFFYADARAWVALTRRRGINSEHPLLPRPVQRVKKRSADHRRDDARSFFFLA